MAISTLTANAKGDSNNSNGADVASSVNAAINLIEGNLGRSNLGNQFNFNGVINSGSVNLIANDGTYTVIENTTTDGPSQITDNYTLRVTSNGNNYTLQEAFSLNDSRQYYARVNRPLIATPVIADWEPVSGNLSKFYKKNVVFIGDSLTESYGLPLYFSQNTGAIVSNFGIGGTRAGRHTSNGYKDLSGFKIAEAMKSGDWTSVVNAGAYTNTNNADDNRPQADGLAATDWSKVDYLIVGYGTNDYGGSNEIGLPTDLAGGLEYYAQVTFDRMVRDITEAAPHIKVLFWFPPWRYNTPKYPTGATNGSDPDGLNDKANDPAANSASDRGIDGNYLHEYVDLLKDKCKKYKQPYVDFADTSGIGILTRTHFLQDGLHPTPAGARRLAENIQAALEARFS